MPTLTRLALTAWHAFLCDIFCRHTHQLLTTPRLAFLRDTFRELNSVNTLTASREAPPQTKEIAPGAERALSDHPTTSSASPPSLSGVAVSRLASNPPTASECGVTVGRSNAQCLCNPLCDMAPMQAPHRAKPQISSASNGSNSTLP